MTVHLFAYVVPAPTPPFITVQRVVVAETAPPKIDKKLSGFWSVLALAAGGDDAAKRLGKTLQESEDTKWILRALSAADRAKLGID